MNNKMRQILGKARSAVVAAMAMWNELHQHGRRDF